MREELISLKTRQVFREYMVDWVLREISDEFDAARIDCDISYQPSVSGQRRTLVEQYYHTVDWTDIAQIRKVLQVFETILQRVEQSEAQSDGHWRQQQKAQLEKLLWCLRKDGFEWTGGRIVVGASVPFVSDIKDAATHFDARHMHDQIRRMESSVESDPSLAIGTAKELIETCCKTILAERGKSVSTSADIPTLTKETLRELRLVPDGIPDSARGSDVIKRLLSNLGTIGNGLAELRGLYGTGHGKHGTSAGLGTRHAKLAVGAAATLVIFLFDTHCETKNQDNV